MKTSKWKLYVPIPIKDLSLWDENPRFPEEYFNKDEQELIEHFLSDPKFEIKKFAEEVVNEFNMPQFEMLDVLVMNGRNIVIEGNRRLTTYKLLTNPSLSDSPAMQDFFREQGSKIDIDENFILMAHVTSDKDEAARFVNRKHNKSNNEVTWTSVERGHFAVRNHKGVNKDVFKVEMSRLVKLLDLPDEIKFAVLNKGYETTFWRIIDTPSARSILEYNLLQNGVIDIKNRQKFNSLLKVIAYNVWKKVDFSNNKINSRDLNKAKQITNYLKSISIKDTSKVDASIKQDAKIVKKSDKSSPKTKKPKKDIYGAKEESFKTLVNPKFLPPKVSSDKIKEVFKELQIIEVAKCSTAVSALVRIAIDVTIKNFLELKNYRFSDKGHLILQAQNNKITLKEKMDYIANQYLQGEYKASVVALNSNLLMCNLNQVMHNSIFSASESSIRDFWKNLFPVLEYLWGEIIKLESQ